MYQETTNRDMNIIAVPKTEENFKIWNEHFNKKNKDAIAAWAKLESSNQVDAVAFFKKFGIYGANKNWIIKKADEPQTLEEHIVDRAFFCSACYEQYSDNFPEDICEERQSFDTMREFADEMASFINRLTSLLESED